VIGKYSFGRFEKEIVEVEDEQRPTLSFISEG
jgi:hypothetical protein